MKKTKGIFTVKDILASLFMLLALAWLTVSLPFVYENHLIQKYGQFKADLSPTAEDETNPLSNTTEEKTEGGVNTLSEYLHDLHHVANNSSIIVKYYKCHPSDLYFAYHPELISPPPEV